MRMRCAYVGCEKTFACYAKLEDHMNVHLNNRPHVCDICDRSYPSKKGLDAHKEAHYPAAFECAGCKKKFVHKASLVRHRTICQRVFECGKCKRIYSKEGNYRRHVLAKHPVKAEGRARCEQCDAVFLSRFSLRTHRRIVHEGVRVACERCGRLYSYKSSLLEHAKRCPPRGAEKTGA